MREKTQKPHVIVIGAGLAGLTCAYELSRHGDINVTLLEARDRVGGRVFSQTIRGFGVDLGGFIIYPWYTAYRDLLKDLGLLPRLKKIPAADIYYELLEQGAYVKKSDLDIPLREGIQLLQKGLLPVLLDRDVAHPRLHDFEYLTIREFIRKTVATDSEHLQVIENFFDIIAQGYCYGDADSWKAAFIAPIIRQTKLYGDVKAASFFTEGNRVLPETLAATIEQLGGTVITGEAVTALKPHSVTTTAGTYTADAVVMAQNVQPELYEQAFPGAKPQWPYTHFYVVVIDVGYSPSINGSAAWGGVFYGLDKESPYHITSAMNLGNVYGPVLNGLVTLNVQVNPTAYNHAHPLSGEELFEHIHEEVALRFPDAVKPKLVTHEYWPQTMPISDELFVEALRNRQGEHGFFVAGDFLGAPSMETAVRTGQRASEQVIAAINSQK